MTPRGADGPDGRAAAKRFERGTDPEMTVVALARAAALLAEYGGATVVGAPVDLDTRGPRPTIPLTGSTKNTASTSTGPSARPARVSSRRVVTGWSPRRHQVVTGW